MPTVEEPSRPRPRPPKLISVSAKRLTTKCKPHTLTYCPSMDLIALATEDELVHVFRLNGQEASGGPYSRHGVGVRGTRWNLNGEYFILFYLVYFTLCRSGHIGRTDVCCAGNVLAVAGSDNIVRLVSAYSGKTVHELYCAPAPKGREDDASISCVGWGAHLTNARSTLEDVLHGRSGSTSGDLGGGKAALEDVLSPGSLSSASSVQRLHRIAADLPRELAVLDVERSLPKLSVLPATGDEYACLFSFFFSLFLQYFRADNNSCFQ